jgi:putative methyltransferase (TIGR04325 family)
MKNSKGYDASNILMETKKSTLLVKSGEAAFERDSVVFDKIQYSWHLLAILLRSAIENDNALNLIDFGGSLGSSYFQNRGFLSNLRNIRWNIVEQKQYSDCGKEYFQDEYLRFYDDLESCMTENKPNCILASGVLQYLPDPYKVINDFIRLGSDYIIVDRTGFCDKENDLITIQNISDEIYTASYPVFFFSMGKFIKLFEPEYELLAEIESNIDPPILSNSKYFFWKGLIFKKTKR